MAENGGGFARIKEEFLLQVDEQQQQVECANADNENSPAAEAAAANQQQQQQQKNGNFQPQRKGGGGRNRGIDRQREQKMSRARAQMREQTMRLCPSVLSETRMCKYGDQCTAEHDKQRYWAAKPEDLGEAEEEFL